MATRFLTINRCPQHGVWSLSIDHNSGGIRITSTKCCGRWNQIHQFSMSEKQLREAAEEFEHAAAQAEREEDDNS